MKDFFRAVRELARKHGLKAHIIVGVEMEQEPSSVRIASDAQHTFIGKDRKFLKRCYDAMEESSDLTLTQLEQADNERGMVN